MGNKMKFLTLFICIGICSALLIGFGANGWSPVVQMAKANKIVTVDVSKEESGVTLLDQDKNKITVRIDVGKMQFVPVSTPEGAFVLPRVKGFSRSFKEGEPTLPVASKLLDIPYGAKLKVKVMDYTTTEIKLSDYGITDPLMPVQPPMSKSEDPMMKPFSMKKSLYKTNAKYALPLGETEILGVMRGIRLAKLAVSPVEYYASENRLTVYSSITLRIKFNGPDWEKTKKEKKKGKSPYYETVNQQILNYDADSKEADLLKYPIKYVIVADRMFESQLQPFIQWKIKKGYNVVVGYTDTIGSTTTAIKNYIEGLYNAGTTEDPAPSFVLFVGDVQQIPSWSGSAGSHITDLRYCEFTGDDLPEIYYGRFSAQNTTQLQPQIDKTLEYEQYTMPDPSYLGEVTLVSGVDSTYASTHGNGQINYGTNYYFNAAHGISTNVWLYPASNGSGVDSDIIQTISDGVGFYNYTAHCSHNGPADPAFDQGDISSLNNAHKYLLGIGNCCLSNTFGSDYSTPCFGEAWLQAADKGGIGWIGGSNNTYWDEDYWWGVGNGPIEGGGPTYAETGIGAYDGVFHDHGEAVDLHYITNGAIIFSGNTAVTEAGSSRTQYYWEIYHLMGDPSVMTYMGVPSNNSVTHPSSLTPSATTVSVQADAGSYVGITFGGVLHGAGYIDDTGSATISLTPFGSAGTADIVVTCQNKIPYESTITVSAGNDPPTAQFSAAPTSGFAPLTVNFTDQSTGATSWSWDFGDTGTSSAQNPSHVYNSPGLYTVTLTATNSYGSDVETKTDYISVTTQQAPVADFTASSTSIYTGQSVTFTDASTNNPTSWSWTFDDGTPASSTDQNPTITYNTVGTFTVELTATNAAGSDTETKTNYITVQDQPLDYCDSQGNNYNYEYIGEVTVGSFTNTSGGSNYTDFTNLTVNLTEGGTFNVSLTPVFPSSTYTEYWKIWIDYNVDGDFEDAGEEVFSGVGTSVVTGDFTVPSGVAGLTRMRVSMKWDAAQTPCEAFSYGEVEDYSVNITAGSVDPPVANFTASATNINEGDSVNFTDTSTNNPTAWSWTFTGGTPATSTVQNPSVTYNTAGIYAVELTATNAGGSDTETKNGYITVNSTGTTLTMETGTVTNVGNSWTTVNLTNTYTSAVIVCTNDLGSTGLPGVVRVNNVTSGSFDVMVQNPSNSAMSGCEVHYLVVEEGVYNVTDHGIKMEAKKVTASATAENNDWVMESRTYSNSYTTPVVLGQVMSYNDSNWSVFWACSGSRTSPPTASVLNAGKNVGEDPSKSRKSRNDETVALIIVEQGSGTVNGMPYTAAVGADTVRGPDNSSAGYSYSFGAVSNASVAILSVAGMDGGNGGWPVLWGSNPLTDNSVTMVFDEDQTNDTERSHTTEQVAYIIFGQ